MSGGHGSAAENGGEGKITRAGDGERVVVQLAKEGEKWWDGRVRELNASRKGSRGNRGSGR